MANRAAGASEDNARKDHRTRADHQIDILLTDIQLRASRQGGVSPSN
jgi:hypothetical protein